MSMKSSIQATTSRALLGDNKRDENALYGHFLDPILRPIQGGLKWLKVAHSGLKSGPKKQPKHKVFGRDIPGTSANQTSGYARQKLYASGLFLLF